MTTPRRERVEPSLYRRLDAAGKVRFEVTYRDSDGRKRWETLPPGSTKTVARNRLAEIRAAKAAGPYRPNPRLRFEDAIAKWWDAQASALRPNTQSTYETSLKRLRAHFGGRAKLADITPDAVASYLRARERAGLKGWTLRGDLTVLGRVFEFATRRLGWSGANPVRSLDRGERPKSDERAKRILTADELSRLIATVDEPYRLLFEFAAGTGARLGEVLGLRWHAIDLDRGTAHISGQLDRHRQYVELKTARSRRTIELGAGLVAKLRAHKLSSARAGDHDYVFTSRTGSGHDHRNVAGRVLARAVKRAGLGAVERDGETVEPAPTFHSLRHSHGSALIADGWDVEEVSARLGHASTAITMQTYIHAFESEQRSEARAARLEAMYGTDLEPADSSGAQQGAAAEAEVVPLDARRTTERSS